MIATGAAASAEAAASPRPANNGAVGAGSRPIAPVPDEACALECHQPFRGGAVVQLGQGKGNRGQFLR